MPIQFDRRHLVRIVNTPVDASPARIVVDLGRWAKGMKVLGRVIVVSAVLATVTMLVLVERLGQTYEDVLVVTEESAELVADAVEPMQAMADDLAALAVTVVDGLESTQALLTTSQQIVDAVGVAAATNIADITAAAADVADRLARQLELIERFIPGDTDSVAEELRALADGLKPVADQLRNLGGQLQTAADQLADTNDAVADLAVRVDAIAVGIAGLTPSLDALGVTATDLSERAAAASDRLDLDLWLLRILVLVVGAAVIAVGVVTQRLAGVLSGGALEVPAGADPPTS